METPSAALSGLGLKLPARRGFLPSSRDPSPETVLPTRILYVHSASRSTRRRGRDLLEVPACGITMNPHGPAALSGDRLRLDWMPRYARRVVRAAFPTERTADRQLGTLAESGQPRARPARR